MKKTSLVRNRFLSLFALALAGALLGFLVQGFWQMAGAQGFDYQWSRPNRLSVGYGKSSEGYPVADAYGYVHVFWSESLPDNRVVLQYSRFDGQTWTSPIDIRLTQNNASIGNISPFVDRHGMLHLVWSEGQSGPVQYMSAPAHDALSIQNWTQPRRFVFPAKTVKFLVDEDGKFHLLYSDLSSSTAGVYYTLSDDQGRTWTSPTRLDPDIPSNWSPAALNFAMDAEGGLHASWFYIYLDAVGGNWVRYAHSLDGGQTWSAPLTISRDESSVPGEGQSGNASSLGFAYPIMAVVGQAVHIVWAEGELFYRHHIYSEDAGVTWNGPVRFMEDLNGQAFESLAVDGLGRVHFFGQIRYPQGIYHAIWDNGRWSSPRLIYLISTGADDPIGERIHAHHTHAAIRLGYQIVLVFANSPPEPDRKLFEMHTTLEDVPPLPPAPLPSPTVTPTPEPTQTSEFPPAATATPRATATPFELALTDPNEEIPGPGSPIWYGTVAVAVLIGGAFAFWAIFRKYQ